MFNKKASKKALFRFPCNQFPFRKKKGTFPRPVPGRGKAGFRRLPPGLRAGQGLGCRRASREAAQGWETRRDRGLGPEAPPRNPGGGTRLGDRAGPAAGSFFPRSAVLSPRCIKKKPNIRLLFLCANCSYAGGDRCTSAPAPGSGQPPVAGLVNRNRQVSQTAGDWSRAIISSAGKTPPQLKTLSA